MKMKKQTLLILVLLALVASMVVWALMDIYAGSNLGEEAVWFRWREFTMYWYWVWFPLSFVIASAFLSLGYYVGTGGKDVKTSIAIFLTGILLIISGFEDFLYFVVGKGEILQYHQELAWLPQYSILGIWTWRMLLIWMVVWFGVIAYMWIRVLRET